MVHLDRLDLSRDVRGRERDDHASLDDTSLNTTNGHRADTADLVNILKGKTERLVGGTDRGLDGIDGIEESLALDDTGLRLLGPALVPGHAVGASENWRREVTNTRAYLVDSSNMLSPCQPEMGTKATALGL